MTVLAFLSCAATLLGGAEPQGTVVSSDGLPLPGVQVSSSIHGPWSTTDVNGYWSLSSAAARRRGEQAVRRVGRWVALDLDSPVSGTLSVRDLSGRAVLPDRAVSLPRGSHRIDLGLRSTSPVLVLWTAKEAPPVAVRESAAGDSLYMRWKGALWEVLPFDPSSPSARVDTLDVSSSALRFDPVWNLLATDSLPGEIGPLAQLGDTLYVGAGNAIWSVPVKGGRWTREFVPGDAGGRGFNDLEVVRDTLFASRGFGADTAVWFRVVGKPWTADPWSLEYRRSYYNYRLCPFGDELYLAGNDGSVWRRSAGILRIAGTGSTFGGDAWLGVTAQDRFVLLQSDPSHWNGQRWVYPGGWGSYGSRGAIWNGRAILRKQLASSGSWDVFAWNFSQSSSVPVRFADSAEQFAMDLRTAGRTLAMSRGIVSGGWDDDKFDGILLRRPTWTRWRRVPVPAGFLPNRLGSGPHRLWVAGNGRVG